MIYLLHIATLSGIYGIAALGLNYASGFTGLVSLNHGAFMGIGAYSSAYLMMQMGMPFWQAFLLGGLITSLVAWLMSFPLLKLHGDAFVLASFGFSFIAYSIFLNWTEVTNGALGMKGIPGPIVPEWGMESWWFLGLVVLVLGGCLLALQRILASSYGVVIRATRENEKVTQIAGHSTQSYRRSVFVLSAFVTGLAGVLLGSYISAIDPQLFNYHLSVLILVMVILGGLASLKGSVIGAVLLIIVPELMRLVGFPNSIIAESRQIVYGLVMIGLMYSRPEGLFGQYRL